jgi:hypothetical protein
MGGTYCCAPARASTRGLISVTLQGYAEMATQDDNE